MTEPKNLQQALEKARRLLYTIEAQIAGHGELNAPPGMLVQRELTKEKIVELQAELNKPTHTYLTRIIAEFERYEDTTNIVFPALKPGTTKEKKGAKREEERLRAFLSNFDPKYSPRNPDTLKPNEQAEEEQLDPFLIKNAHIALLGEPGAGKSTALRGLFREYAQRWEQDSSQPIPQFSHLNRWQETETLLEFLQKEAPELADSLPTLLKEGRILLLLDGLNELPSLMRNKNTNEIEDPRSQAIARLSHEHPKVLCLLSCRVKEFKGGPGWCDLHVLPLRRKQVEAITHAYFDDEPEKASQLITRLYDGKLEKLQTLAEKPFYLKRLLAYFGAIGEIPANPSRLLAYSVDMAIDDEVNKGLLKVENIEKLKEKLSLLAFNITEVMKVSTNQVQAAGWLFHLRETRWWLNNGLKEPEAKAIEYDAAKILLNQGEHCGLLSQQGTKVKFAHQLLQEYFCALFLQNRELNNEWLHRLTGVFAFFDEVWPLWAGLDNTLVERVMLILKNENSEGRSSAAFALGLLGDSRAIEPLIHALKSENSNLRFYAAQALGKIGDARAVEPLIQALMDENENIRENAAWALGEIGDVRAIEPLIQALKKSDYEHEGQEEDEVELVGNTFVQALWQFGTLAVEPLILALKDESAYLRYFAIRALGYIRDVKAIEPLILALKDENLYIRKNAALALGEIGDVRAIEPLIQVFKDKVWFVYNAASEALEEIGTSAVEPLILALKDKNVHIRKNASWTLGKIGDARAVEPLIQALMDRNMNVGKNAAWALGKIGDARAVEPLIQALKGANSNLRFYAARSLGEIGDVRAVEPLIKALKSKHKYVRLYTAQALGKIGDARAVEPLIQTLLDLEVDVHPYAIEALGKIGDARAVEPLFQAFKLRDKNGTSSYSVANSLMQIGKPSGELLILALKDEDENIRDKAAWALGQIGDVRAVEPLIQALNDEVWYVCNSAAEALGKIADTRAVEPLIQALKDENDHLRFSAAEAIGRIEDSRALPELERLAREDTDNLTGGQSVRVAAIEAIDKIKARQQSNG